MSNEKLTFSRHPNVDFYNTLRKRVNRYFKLNKISKFGGGRMVSKSIILWLLYIGPLLLMLTGVIQMPWLMVPMWIIMGFGIAGVGMSVMHDANHGSFSKYPIVNRIIGYSINLMGANAGLWKVQHNEKHHTYPNIEGKDDDINRLPFLRFSPHQEIRGIYRFQHIYAWVLYSFNTLAWITVIDFITVNRHRKSGRFMDQKAFVKALIKIIVWKLFYFSCFLALPMVLLPVSPFFVLGCFVMMQLVAGLILSVIFQSAHVLTTSKYPEANQEGRIESSWAVHQIETTSNFSPKNRLLTWMIGGLNYQIEHHLFSHISHVHYHKISRIVAGTAKEFGVNYHSYQSIFGAVSDHARMLRQLGKNTAIPPS